MEKANYIGTTSFEFLNRSASNWGVFPTEDIINEGIISKPGDYYIATVGSGVFTDMNSLATTPSFPIPTNSQTYLAGRDVLRWGGPTDPFEIDLDHYGFTPVYERNLVVVWKDPKSQLHHLSKRPDIVSNYPEPLKEICEAVFNRSLS